MKTTEFFKNRNIKFGIQVLLVIFGCCIMGVAYNCFYTPNSITPSGFMGLATIFCYWMNNALSPSVLYLLINVVLFLVALKFFGLKFAILTGVGIGGFTLATQFLTIPALISTDPLLSCFIGGALNGIGGGICFYAGGSTGGSDIVTLLLNKFFPKMKTGTCSFFVSFVVIVLNVATFGVNLSLYAIIAIFTYSKFCDVILDGSKTVRAFYIICDKDEEVAESILQAFHRGVTKVEVEGAFSHKNKKMLICLVPNTQAPMMKSIIHETDPNSFVYSTAVSEMLGEGFFTSRASSIRKNKIKCASKIIKSKNKVSRKTQIKSAKIFKKRCLKVIHTKN